MKPDPAPRAGMPSSGPPPCGGGKPKRRKKSSSGSSEVGPAPGPRVCRTTCTTSTFTTALPYCSTSGVKSGSAVAPSGARVGTTAFDWAVLDGVLAGVGWSAPLPSEQAESTAYSVAKRTGSEIFMGRLRGVRMSDITGFNDCGPS